MEIEVVDRLSVFSHRPGVCLLLPGTFYEVQAFPTLLIFKNLQDQDSKEKIELHLDLQGPFKEFTFFLNLEKGHLEFAGHTLLGYVHFSVFAKKEGISIRFDRGIKEGVSYSLSANFPCPFKKKKGTFFPNEELALIFDLPSETVLPLSERLFLGVTKAKDWDRMAVRSDLKEIFPLWLRLGQILPLTNELKAGTALLLDEIHDLIEKKKVLEIEKSFIKLFHAGFFEMMVPELNDSCHLGIVKESDLPKNASPFVLLKEGSSLIRSLFFQEKKKHLQILPCLPPSFFSGRFIGVRCSSGELDLEWTKKMIRKMVFRSFQDSEIKLDFPSKVASFRVRMTRGDKGRVYQPSDLIKVEKDQTYYFDRFFK